jgi:surface antigen
MAELCISLFRSQKNIEEHHMRTRHTITTALVCAALLGQVHAAGLGFMSNTPLSRLKPDEITGLNKTIVDALEHSKIGQSEIWSNAETQSSNVTSVKITPTREFERNGLNCRQVKLNFTNKVQNDVMNPSYCKGTDGTWELAPPNSAKAPKASAAS